MWKKEICIFCLLEFDVLIFLIVCVKLVLVKVFDIVEVYLVFRVKFL